MNTTKNHIESLLEQAHAIRTYNLSESITLTEEALILAQEIKNDIYIGRSLNQLSLYNMIIGKMEIATNYGQKAIQTFEKLKDQIGIANAKYSLAAVYYKTNQYHLGLMNFSDALKIYKEYNDYANQSRTEKSLGTIYEFIGDTTSAFKEYKKAVQHAKIAGDLNLESNVYNNLSGILAKKGKLIFAMRFIKYSITLKKQTNDLRGLGYALYGKAKVFHYSNEISKAKKYYFKALLIHEQMSESLGIVMTLTKIATLYYELKNYSKSLKYIKKGIRLSVKLNFSMSSIKLNHLAYLIHKELGLPDKALHYLETHLQQKNRVINTQSLKVIESYELITKMKSLENEAILQKQKQKLLEAKNQEDLENYRRKQEFLSIMSHEIRTPLNAITSSISLLDDHVDTKGKQILTNLKFASNNLINIVNDVLALNKLDNHTTKLQKTVVNLNYLCQNIIELYERLASEKNLKLIYKTEVNYNNHYWIDQTKLSQILCNIICNAVKFTDIGEVQFELKVLQSAPNYDLIQFRIKDTGEGIEEEFRNQIFESFSQIKPYLTRKQGGTGLGLAIVKKLAELHETIVHLESEPKKGSLFYFDLNLERALPVNNLPDDIEKEGQLLKGKHVLIVDDTKINALLLSKLLKKWELKIDYATNGVEAVSMSKSKKYDFILMDIHMPNMNGFEASKIIKENIEINSQTPIIALTADILADTDESFSKYFSGIFFKPFEVDKLYSYLKLHIQKD